MSPTAYKVVDGRMREAGPRRLRPHEHRAALDPMMWPPHVSKPRCLLRTTFAVRDGLDAERFKDEQQTTPIDQRGHRGAPMLRNPSNKRQTSRICALPTSQTNISCKRY